MEEREEERGGRRKWMKRGKIDKKEERKGTRGKEENGGRGEKETG